MTPERGQIVWINFNPQKGHEQSGRRPALVVSPTAYNGLSNCVVVCPITSNTSPWPWKVMLPEESNITGYVLVDQVKSIDGKARNIEASGHFVDSTIMDDVIAKLATLTG